MFVKRDDLLSKVYPGNKARKLASYLEKPREFYLGRHLVSIGGTQSNAMVAIAAMANRLLIPFTYFSYSSSERKLWEKPLEDSNLDLAKRFGMKLVMLPKDDYERLSRTDRADYSLKDAAMAAGIPPDQLLEIPQGVACMEAESGLAGLARELNAFNSSRLATCVLATEGRRAGSPLPPPLCVIIPGGTGCTAAYLALHLDASIACVVVPCVTSAGSLRQRMRALSAQSMLSESEKKEPVILYRRRYRMNPRFGRLNSERLTVVTEVRGADTYVVLPPDDDPADACRDGIELPRSPGLQLDLLYAAHVWATVFGEPTSHVKRKPERWRDDRKFGGAAAPGSRLAGLAPSASSESAPFLSTEVRGAEDEGEVIEVGADGRGCGWTDGLAKYQLLFLHCGGLSGNKSMLERYERAEQMKRNKNAPP